ncbi:hypothetical protein HK101_007937 [Irineochytrium annulatum]|nr:hypothetical protein HK101_007937 [Irineochytrium annulatum]
MRPALIVAFSLLATAYAIPFPQADSPAASATTNAAALATPIADTPILTPDTSTNATAPAEASNNATAAAAPEPPEPSFSDAVGGSPSTSAPQGAAVGPAGAPAPEASPDALDSASGPMDDDEAAQSPEEAEGEGGSAQERDDDREGRPTREHDAGDREDAVRAFPYDEAMGAMPSSEVADQESPDADQSSYPTQDEEEARSASDEDKEQASPAEYDASAAAVPDDDEDEVATVPTQVTKIPPRVVKKIPPPIIKKLPPPIKKIPPPLVKKLPVRPLSQVGRGGFAHGPGVHTLGDHGGYHVAPTPQPITPVIHPVAGHHGHAIGFNDGFHGEGHHEHHGSHHHSRHHHNRHFRYHRNLRYRSRRRMLLRHRLSRFNLSGKQVRYGSTFYHKKGLLAGEGYGAQAVPGDVTYKQSYYGGVKGRIIRTGSDKTAFKRDSRRRYRKMRVHHG